MNSRPILAVALLGCLVGCPAAPEDMDVHPRDVVDSELDSPELQLDVNFEDDLVTSSDAQDAREDLTTVGDVWDAGNPDGRSGLDVPRPSDVLLGDAAVTCTVRGTPGDCRDLSLCVAPSVSTPGFCPGPSNIQCCTRPPEAGWCPTDAVVDPNVGYTEEAPGMGLCPAGMVEVAGFCMDRFEASLVEESAGIRVPLSPFVRPRMSPSVRAVSVEGAVPQGYISGLDAEWACENAGKRLCLDSEWLRACKGSTGRTYPYGSTRVWDRCNDRRAVHPAIECFGTNDAWIWSSLDYSGINQLPNSLERTGTRTECLSQDGVLDLVGNLHEWTADPNGTFRGGFYVDTVINGEGCNYATTAHARSHWDYSTGFRCCADVP